MSSPRVLPIAILLALALPAAGEAATVSVDQTPVLAYVASSGEANRLVITYSAEGNSAVVTDPGATVTAGAGCVAIDTHSARCGSDNGDVGDLPAGVSLGDGNDTVAIAGPTEPNYNTATIDGGPGDDTITGTPESDVLYGGGGTDTISGGAGDDLLADGDGALGDADAFDGGEGSDRVTYAERATAVVADLRGGGEDAFASVERLVGGSGDDSLTGSDAPETLSGGGGDDAISGNGGDDILYGRGGDDLLTGGDGRDILNGIGGRDEFDCGAGSDIVIEPAQGVLVPPTCELGRFFNSPSSLTLRNSTTHPLQAHRITGDTAFMRLRCANESVNDFGEYAACAGRLVIRERDRRHRILAEARFADDGDRRFVVRAKLTAAGRRAIAKPSSVPATAFVTGAGVLRQYRWTFFLRP